MTGQVGQTRAIAAAMRLMGEMSAKDGKSLKELVDRLESLMDGKEVKMSMSRNKNELYIYS